MPSFPVLELEGLIPVGGRKDSRPSPNLLTSFSASQFGPTPSWGKLRAPTTDSLPPPMVSALGLAFIPFPSSARRSACPASQAPPSVISNRQIGSRTCGLLAQVLCYYEFLRFQQIHRSPLFDPSRLFRRNGWAVGGVCRPD